MTLPRLNTVCIAHSLRLVSVGGFEPPLVSHPVVLIPVRLTCFVTLTLLLKKGAELLLTPHSLLIPLLLSPATTF